MNDQIIPVTFHGDTLALVDHEGEPFVAMKPMVENMGLAWQSQHIKLSDKFGATITIIVTVGEDGKQREMLCLPLRKLPAWLYSITPSKVKPELRDKIVSYQEECDDVLWKYWTQGHVERPGGTNVIAAHRHVIALLKELKRETNPAVRRVLHAQLVQGCRMSALPCPDLEEIGHAEEPAAVPAVVETFWETVELIGLEKLNHSRSTGKIALNLVHFHKVADEAKIKVPPLDALRRALRLSESPRFLDVKTTNSALLDRSVKCWVFEAEPAPD